MLFSKYFERFAAYPEKRMGSLAVKHRYNLPIKKINEILDVETSYIEKMNLFLRNRNDIANVNYDSFIVVHQEVSGRITKIVSSSLDLSSDEVHQFFSDTFDYMKKKELFYKSHPARRFISGMVLNNMKRDLEKIISFD